MGLPPSHEESIHLEEALILSQKAHPGNQFILRLHAPYTASAAKPGQFVHLQTDTTLPMRRPISIMRTLPQNGIVELLYKRIGQGTALLAKRQTGETLSLMGPIGKGFHIASERALLIGGGVGMPPIVFLAQYLRTHQQVDCLVVLGSEIPFPFKPIPSQHKVAGVDETVTAAMPILDDWGIPSRLASQQNLVGCHRGYVTEVAQQYLHTLDDTERSKVTIYACGPEQMLRAVVELAQHFELQTQTSLEEYMACGVGGCAGCVVSVMTDTGLAMKRVCIDGPVFDGAQVFF